MHIYELKRNIKSNKLLYPLYLFFYSPVRRLKQVTLAKEHYPKFYNQYSNLNVSRRKILYIGIPLHPNLGDQAQYFCTLNWLENNYNGYDILEVPDSLIITNYNKCIEKIKKLVKDDDVIVFQSGYRTTDIGNSGGESAHRIIIENFKDNKILVLPQTVNFKNKFEFYKSRKYYKMNKNILFLARDSHSYNLALTNYHNKVLLYPDIVTSLIGKYEFKSKRNGLLFCVRNDAEKLYSDTDIDCLIKKYEKKMNVLKTDTTINIPYDVMRNNLKEIIESKFEEFSKYKIIITDRYHGTIFGLISHTPTIVLSSSDHKVSSGVDWFKNKQEFKDFIYFAEDLKEIDNLIALILEKHDYNKKLSNYFQQEYYDKLKLIFESE